MSDTVAIYCRNPGILQRELDGEIFLIDDTLGKIHALDPMACGIWRLLEQPITIHDIVAIFLAAFPDRKSTELRRQISRFLNDMRQNNLVMRAA